MGWRGLRYKTTERNKMTKRKRLRWKKDSSVIGRFTKEFIYHDGETEFAYVGEFTNLGNTEILGWYFYAYVGSSHINNDIKYETKDEACKEAEKWVKEKLARPKGA